MATLSTTLEILSNDVIRRSQIVTEINQDSTDDMIPTAKAVYDFVSGGN